MSNNLKIGIVIPDRPGREMFYRWWEMLLDKQVLNNIKPVLFHEDWASPMKMNTDLALRCKSGVSKALKEGCELIFFWENDDYYPPEYLLTMTQLWHLEGKPDAVGSHITMYVHVEAEKFFTQRHDGRSSLFHTAVSADFMRRFGWDKALSKCPFLDIELWGQAKTKAFTEPLAIGLKHGIGYAGGKAHNPMWPHYTTMPKGFLDHKIGKENAEAYRKMVF